MLMIKMSENTNLSRRSFSSSSLLTAGGVVLLLTILFIFFVSVRQSQRAKDTSEEINRTLEILVHIQKLAMAALDNETGARGYVISGKESYKLPLTESEKNFREELDYLYKNLRDVRGRAMLDTAAQFIVKRRDFSDSMLSARDRSLEEVIRLVETGRGKFYTDEIRRLSQAMEDRQHELLAVRKGKNESAIRYLNSILFSVLAGFLVFSLLMIYRIRRDVLNRQLSEARFRALLDSAPDATIIADEKGTIRMVNRQAEVLFRYNREEMTGKPVEILVPAGLRAAHVHHRNSFMKKASVRAMGAGIELFAVKKDGGIFPVEISLSPISTDEGNRVSASVRDITHRKELEMALRKSNEEMEAFTYSVSHDLRAPLRGIVGFTSILEEEYGQKLDEEGRRITGIIRQNTLKMGQLIDDLLSFSRAGKQQLQKQEINMNQLIGEVLAEFSRQGLGHTVHWEIADLPEAWGDLTTIRQVWVNLLSNAVKYSSKKEKPLVQVSARSENGELIYRVRDNGVGFDNKYGHKLFRVFQRLHSAEEFEGTGVGLALVEKIIVKHGGRVGAEGWPGEGAEFYFSLPSAK